MRKYCTSNVFSIAQYFEGVLKLCEYLAFVKVTNTDVEINPTVFSFSDFARPDAYFEHYHFFGHLFAALQKDGAINPLFNEGTLKFSAELNRYYVKDNRIPFKFYVIRNLLLSTGFFARDPYLQNNLLIKEEFTGQFRESVGSEVVSQWTMAKKSTLDQLKAALSEKEELGRLAEFFVLEYERARLYDHPEIEKILRISEKFTNAGYDIESFDDRDSILNDRFIEVKSYEGNPLFYWSRNEVEIARKLGPRYFLYLVDRAHINQTVYRPLIFQDPYKTIFKNELWEKAPESWKLCIE